jgi:hypothetical protein
MDFKALAFKLSDISDISELLPVLIILSLKNKNQFKVLGIFFAISSCLKLFTLITAIKSINNMPAFHLLAIVEVCFLFTFYNQVSFRSPRYATVLISLILLNLLNSIVIQGPFQFNSYAWSFNTLFLLLCGLLYLYNLYQGIENIKLERNPTFAINAGLMIYFSGSLFTYVLGWDILSGDPKGFFHNAWIIQCISNISKNIIVSYGIWLARFN